MNNLLPKYSLSNEDLNALKAIQFINTRVYFDDDLAKTLLCKDDITLKSLGVPRIFSSMLVNTDSARFIAESYGRRFYVAKEIYTRFKRSLKFLIHKELEVSEFLTHSIFVSFLKSEYFFSSNYCFPHPDAIGKGYENVSKFFLWIINSLPPSTVNYKILDSLFLDIAIFLVAQSRTATEPFYLKFQKGVYFQSNKSHEDKLYEVFIISKDLEIAKTKLTDRDKNLDFPFENMAFLLRDYIPNKPKE